MATAGTRATDRHEAEPEEELRKLNRTLRAISNCNQALLHFNDESALLKAVCRIIVEDCGHAMVWIGLAEEDENKTIRPVAWSGFEDGYLETLRLTWSEDHERGRGPTGTAIRTGQPAACRNMLIDPTFEPWRAEAIKRGYSSSIALPLCDGDRAFGAITIYFREPDPFSEDELKLLTELAGDLAYGLVAIRLRAAHARAEAALRQSEERYRGLVELSPDAIMVHRDNRVEYVNPSALRLLGAISAEQVLGRSPLEFFHPAYHPLIQERLAKLRQGQCTPLIEEKAVRFDGELVDVEVTASPFHDAGGPAIQVILRDITERKRNEEALRGANLMLAEADRRKDEFLAMLSHELRNPLAPVRNAVQVLRMVGANDAFAARQHNIIDRQVTHMARLLDDLLDISRITRGKIVLKKQALHLPDVLPPAIEAATPLIEARRQTISVTLPADDLQIEGDLDRLTQVVGNLLSNATKYTDEGGQIWLSVGLEDGQAVVRVRDTGVGIAPEMLPRVFDLFAQADRSLDRAQGGLGIGLTMVKSLVELHGGTVEAHSAGLGQGSEFVVRLPVLAEELQTNQVRPSARIDTAGTPARRILIVDDVRDSADSMAELLRLWGQDVQTAYDGLGALAAARAYQPDIVLLDIGLPGLNGYETAQRLRAEFGPRKMLLVAMTGYGQREDQERTHQAGFDLHLTKPVDLDVLKMLLIVPQGSWSGKVPGASHNPQPD